MWKGTGVSAAPAGVDAPTREEAETEPEGKEAAAEEAPATLLLLCLLGETAFWRAAIARASALACRLCVDATSNTMFGGGATIAGGL